MPVQAISNLYQTEPNLYTQQAPDQLGKEDFLQLLITQIQQQDPLNPQDPAEFTSQLTQFSNLEQLMSLNDSVLSLQMLQMSGNNTEVTNLIGNRALFEGNTLEHTAGSDTQVSYYLPSAATHVSVSIYNSNGGLVDTMNLGGKNAGIQHVDWNGTDSLGNELGSGEYTFSVQAVDAAGNTVDSSPLMRAIVEGIYFDDGETFVTAGGYELRYDDIYGVEQGNG